MKWISHRGNVDGPNLDMENSTAYIGAALQLGYDVEIDVWLLSDGFYLGHDEPKYKTTRFFLQNKKLWVHCKNIDAFVNISKYQNINCFFQSDEEMVITSHGYLWAHSNCNVWNNKTVITKLDSGSWKAPEGAYAVCSDYVRPQNEIEIPFDLLIIDIDGVMTNGTKMYDNAGSVFGKTYSDLDFTAIKRFKAAGIEVCFLSGDKNINQSMAKTRKIDFFHNVPGVDKVDMLNDIKKHYDAKKVAYVGDDYYDIAIMNSVDLAFCPQTSFTPVKQAAITINVEAGKGVIAGLYDIFENKIPYVFPVDSPDVNPK